MRILHTADWHLGKLFYGDYLTDDQAYVLTEQLLPMIRDEGIDAVVLAGDVYDRSLPPADAVALFDEIATKITAEAGVPFFVISGNHDDNVRLGAATALCEPQGIYIYGNYGYVPHCGGRRKIRVAEAGTNHIVFEKNGEVIYCNVLPYPNESRLKEDKNPNESYLDKMQRWIAAGQAACSPQPEQPAVQLPVTMPS